MSKIHAEIEYLMLKLFQSERRIETLTDKEAEKINRIASQQFNKQVIEDKQ